MRNLKKILSLVLALVMVFSLMTFASAKDFNDAGDIEHTEAVEVLTALEVIDGVGNNTFNPAGKVTRAQMAKMITLISLGNVSVDAFKGVSVDLNDISGHWAEAYIKYCYSQGIISGKGNGRFDPDANVTTVEAAKMLLVAIGFNSDVQVYEGPSWNVNVIRDAQTNDIFEKLSLASDLQISRDQAAQMMYNALNTGIIEKSSSVSRVDGSIIDEYKKNTEGKNLLSESFKGQIWVGTFDGNNDFANGSGAGKGEISVNGALESVYATAAHKQAIFPYDYDIANIGEQVKVIFKDGTMGTKNQPDKYDTIYGVYKTGATSVVNATMNDVANQKSSKAQIKVGGVTYNTVTALVGTPGVDTPQDVPVIFNFNNEDTARSKSYSAVGTDVGEGANSALTDAIKATKSDAIKLIFNDRNQVERIYVTEYKTGRVSSVSSSKVTIDGVGSIDIDDNNIYSGIAVDDVVVYTKFYKNAKDDAYFTVTLAETVEGTLNGFKLDGGIADVVVNGTTYKVYNKTLEDRTDDKITTLTTNDSHIGDQVRIYLVNGMVSAMKALEENGGKYALVVDVSTNGTIGSNIDPLRVTVLLPDGTEQTLTVHKDSVSNGSGGTKLESDGDQLRKGVLVEYSSISDNTIKIYNLATVSAAEVTGTLWDKDTKALTYTGSTSAVAAANAVLFVTVDNDPATVDSEHKQNGYLDRNDKWYAYDLRSMGTISTSQISIAGNEAEDKAVSAKKIQYLTNDSGLIVAAYAVLGNRPSSSGSNTLYGIATKNVGTREINGTSYTEWTVSVNGENKTVNVDNSSPLGSAMELFEGAIVEFDETADTLYSKQDMKVLVVANDKPVGNDDNALANNKWVLAAADGYNAGQNLLTFYAKTTRASATESFKGLNGSDEEKAISKTTTNDVKLFAVNTRDNRSEERQNPVKFNTANGYANLLFHVNNDGLVDVIVYNATTEGNIAVKGKGDKTDVATILFGSTVAPLENSATPVLTKTPDATTATLDAGTGKVTLSVAVSGTNGGTVTQEWKKEGSDTVLGTGTSLEVNAAGLYTVTVTNTEAGKTPKTATASWTVSEAGSPTPSVTSVTVSPDTITLDRANQTKTATVTVAVANGAETTLKAAEITPAADGKFTATITGTTLTIKSADGTAKVEGTFTVKVISAVDETKYDEVAVTLAIPSTKDLDTVGVAAKKASELTASNAKDAPEALEPKFADNGTKAVDEGIVVKDGQELYEVDQLKSDIGSTIDTKFIFMTISLADVVEAGETFKVARFKSSCGDVTAPGQGDKLWESAEAEADGDGSDAVIVALGDKEGAKFVITVSKKDGSTKNYFYSYTPVT